jgi:flagellar hook-length control protein FliK
MAAAAASTPPVVSETPPAAARPASAKADPTLTRDPAPASGLTAGHGAADMTLDLAAPPTQPVAGSIAVTARTVASPERVHYPSSAAAESEAAAPAPRPPSAAPSPAPAAAPVAVVAAPPLPVQDGSETDAQPAPPTPDAADAPVRAETAEAEAAPPTPRLDTPAPRPLRDAPRIHDRVAAVNSDAVPSAAEPDQAPTTTAAPPAATGRPLTAPAATSPAAAEATAPLASAALTEAPQTTPETPVETPRASEPTAASPGRDLTFSQFSRATVETTAHLAATIARKLEGRSTRFDMVLTPEDLGRVEVSLEIDADGHLAARLAFDNPAAAADLRSRADELRRQLQDAGFQVASDSLEFSQRDPSSGGGAFDRQQRNALFAGGSRVAAQADLAAAPPVGAWTNRSLTPDRVDVRV